MTIGLKDKGDASLYLPILSSPASQTAGLFIWNKVSVARFKALSAWGSSRQALRAGDTLVVCRLDPLGRSFSDLVKIIDYLERNGITFESLSEKIDTGSASGKLQFHVFAALAEFERNLIRERTMAGLTAARARGRVGGRKPKLSEK